MKALEEKILSNGVVINNEILKVDSFLNYQINVKMLREICKFIVSHFKNQRIDKILTIEASGIAFALGVAIELNNIDLVFAKKCKSSVTFNDENYTSLVHSFTHNIDNNIYVKRDFIKEGENILIVDDFLAEGNAAIGLVRICKQAKANIVGVAAGIEKTFQGGRNRLESMGVKVCSCARIEGFNNNVPVFSMEEC